MKRITVTVIGFVALLALVRQVTGGYGGVAHAQSLHARSTVIAVQHGSLVVRAGGRISMIPIQPSARVISADHLTLRLSSVRPGDTVVPAAGRLIGDISQRSITMQGLVDLSATGETVPTVIVVRGATSIVASLSSATRYLDRTDRTTKLADLADGDAVIVQGIYDSHLGEVTQATQVTRVGPVLKRHTAHSGNG